MKQDTKKIMLIGGVALAGLYAYSTLGGEDYAGMGGGGGAPLLPAIVEAATGAETAAPIIVNIAPMQTPEWGTEEVAYTKKNEFASGGIPIPTPTASGETKKYGGFTLPELRAAPFEFFESDIFAKQTGLMTRKRTSEVVGDMLSESRKRGFIRTKKIEAQQGTSAKRDGGYGAQSGDAFTRLGQRSYSGARSAALSSSKKAQRKPGSPD